MEVCKPIKVYCDNQSIISMTKNPVFHSRRKHIDIQHHFIRELVQQGFISFEFCKSEYQIADIFTKALPKDRLEKLISLLGIQKLDIKGETGKRDANFSACIDLTISSCETNSVIC